MNQPKVIVVTGASTGFGRLIAETLARRGYSVVATMRDVGGRNATHADEIRTVGPSIEPLELDVTNETSVERAVQTILEKHGRIDVVVNNAGYAVVDLLESFTVEQAQRLFDTNFFGALRMNRAVLPAMKRQGSGLLLHVSSGAGRLVFPSMGLYCASKFALEAMAEAYRYELAALGIDSVLIEPGAYPTPIMTKLVSGDDESRKAGYGEAAEIPRKLGERLSAAQGNPQEVADRVLEIIETPAGERHLRYRVAPTDSGALARVNALSAEVQAQVLESMGMTAATRFKKPTTPR